MTCMVLSWYLRWWKTKHLHFPVEMELALILWQRTNCGETQWVGTIRGRNWTGGILDRSPSLDMEIGGRKRWGERASLQHWTFTGWPEKVNYFGSSQWRLRVLEVLSETNRLGLRSFVQYMARGLNFGERVFQSTRLRWLKALAVLWHYVQEMDDLKTYKGGSGMD